MREPTIIKMTPFPNDSWTRVELFLRAHGRLPETMDDVIDQKTLDLFCEKYEKGELKTATTNLDELYRAIKRGEVEIDNSPQTGVKI